MSRHCFVATTSARSGIPWSDVGLLTAETDLAGRKDRFEYAAIGRFTKDTEVSGSFPDLGAANRSEHGHQNDGTPVLATRVLRHRMIEEFAKGKALRV